MSRSAFALAAALFCSCALVAQTPAAKQASENSTQTPVMRVNSEEVSLDMVFRDKKGRAIDDIRPNEVHVYENGVEEHLNSFRFVSGGNAAVTKAAATVPSLGPTPLDPMRNVRLVTLVFENLDTEGKRFFRQALEDIVKMAPEQNLYFSVVVIDQKLNMILPFTNDREALLKSVDKSVMWSFAQYDRNSAEIESQLRQTLTNGEPASESNATGDETTPPALSGSATSGPSQSQINNVVNWKMAKMQYDMLQQADASEREAGARGTIDALLSLVRAESQLPGRKVVLYFNPSLFIPEIAKEQYSYMISAANRANITFYTVDPKGLVTWSQENAGRSQLSGATGELRREQLSGGVGAVTQAEAQVDETAENGIRSNPLLWLKDLAQQTGGATIANTNDLNAPLRMVMNEVQSYYEASYNPHIKVLDGKFRRISVRVDRPGIVVHSRSGYFALPRLASGQHLLAYEVPLLKALSAPTRPDGVPLQAAAERFSERGPNTQYMVTLQVSLKELTFAPQKDGKSALLDAPLLAVIRNSSGDIVEKFSKPFAVQEPLSAVDRLKKGYLIQSFPTELAPGTYTLEAVIMDRGDNKTGVKQSTFTVPQPTDKLAISDVVIIDRTDKLKDNKIVNPFYFPGGKISPSLNTSLKGGSGNVLPFYFAVYPDPAIKDAPKLTMAFYKENQYLGSAEAPLPPAGKDGRIPYIADLPADKFTPGSYEIRLGVTQGASTVEETVDFSVD